MATVLPVKGVYPVIPECCFLGANAVIVGDVVLGSDCSVWFNAVVRGDVNRIRIGDRTNIQDGVVIHCTYLKAETIIGNDVSIGHNAIVHGCTLGNNILVGMGAIVMDNARIEDFVILAAGTVVLENTVCTSGFLYAGVPARKIKALTEEQMTLLRSLPENYRLYSSWFTDEL